MYQLLSQHGAARRGVFHTPHGDIQMPAFMNVATAGAIKGAVSALDLKRLKCQVQLCNTYHLHLRPGDDVVRKLGGLHRFTRWDGPILTDSGGFQVFSLAKLRNIKEEGRHVCFPCGWPQDFYGSGAKHAHPIQPRFHHCNGI